MSNCIFSTWRQRNFLILRNHVNVSELVTGPCPFRGSRRVPAVDRRRETKSEGRYFRCFSAKPYVNSRSSGDRPRTLRACKRFQRPRGLISPEKFLSKEKWESSVLLLKLSWLLQAWKEADSVCFLCLCLEGSYSASLVIRKKAPFGNVPSTAIVKWLCCSPCQRLAVMLRIYLCKMSCTVLWSTSFHNPHAVCAGSPDWYINGFVATTWCCMRKNVILHCRGAEVFAAVVSPLYLTFRRCGIDWPGWGLVVAGMLRFIEK